MRNCIILCGVSGAGKSTWSKKYLDVHPDTHVCSADQYFTKGGEYKFDPSQLGKAHDYCLRNFIISCTLGSSLYWEGKDNEVFDIIVDNTNTTMDEIAPYYRVAKALDYQVELVNLWVDSKLAAARNVHSVSERSIVQMQKRLSERVIPKYWELKVSNYRWNGAHFEVSP